MRAWKVTVQESIFVLALILAALGLVAESAGAELPKVALEVHVDSQIFQGGFQLTGAAPASAEARIGQTLEPELEKRLGYLDWMPVGGARSELPFGLIVRIVDRETGCGSQALLGFSVRTKSSPETRLPAWDREVTRSCSPDGPTGDPDWLHDRVVELVRDLLDIDRFIDNLEDSLGEKVPIATELPVRNRAIGIPLRPEALGADLNSHLRATFKAQANSGLVDEGVIEMKLARPASWGTVCRVESFSFVDFSFADLAGREQDPKFEVILDSGRLREVNVFMREFIPGERQATVNASGLLADP